MLTIRPATVDDEPAIRQIYAETAGLNEKFEEDFDRLLASGGILVALIDDQIAGFGGIDLRSSEQIKWLYLRPEHQHKRIGSQLLSNLENIGWSAKLDTLRVHAAPGADTFYRRHGYHPIEQAQQIEHHHAGIEMEKMSLERRVAEALREDVSIVAYDANWPAMFAAEEKFLWDTLPASILKRIEHFGSTAVPNLSAKPIIDILIEVTSFEETKQHIVPVLQEDGYDYFWRTDVKVPYPWFIKRNAQGVRTHHLHMITADSKWWDRLYFRDYLRLFPSDAAEYEELKRKLAAQYPNDRKAYTDSKSEFILGITEKAKTYFAANPT